MNTDITPTTGVYSGNDVDWTNLQGENEIDLDYETAYAEMVEQGIDEDDPCAYWEDFQGTTLLIGDWVKDDDGKYIPDPSGEYALIYDNNDNVIQVVHSTRILYGRMASPCYPGQVDAHPDEDTDDPESGNAYYALPTWALHTEEN